MQEEWVSPTFHWLTLRMDYVRYAFEQVGYEGIPEGECGPEGFAQRWGGLDVEHFARALQEGQKEDRLLAIFALGYHRIPWVAELLLPFLQSSVSQERWASALSLGFMQEEHAFPMLLDMLTEYLPPPDWPEFQGYDLWLYNGWRGQAILVIAEWNRPEAIPQLLHALGVFQNIEQAIPEARASSRRYWTHCLWDTIYALGWLGSFEILKEGVVTPRVPKEWYVCLALGSLHAHLRYSLALIFHTDLGKYPDLQEKVITVLKEQMALSAEEQEECLKAFAGKRKAGGMRSVFTKEPPEVGSA